MPRYVWLYQSLRNEIGSGRYRVDSMLPTEEQLASVYGVSRHTVREAMRKLVDEGLVVRRAGLGTLVRARHPSAPYVAGLGSLEELMDYTSRTRLEVLGQSMVRADAALAREVRCAPGSQWLELQTRRHLAGQEAPISVTRVYLRPEFSRLREHLHGDHPSIYELLRRLFQQEVASVLQQIEATLMPAPAARLLQVKARGPALRMTRCYFDAAGILMSASVNLYVAERFQLVTRWDTPSGQLPAARSPLSTAKGSR